MKKATKQGSLWRRWDLHLHTPDTKLSNAFKSKSGGDVWEEYLDALEASDVSVFGITDYFCCKNYFTAIEKYAARFPDGKGKVFFPNVEFRLSEAIGKGGTSPDLHVIFDNDPSICPRASIEKFLGKLKTHKTTLHGSAVFCSDLSATQDFESATVSISDARQALKDTFGDKEPYIIVFPAKNDGMKSVDTGSPRKISITNEIDRNSHAFFGGSDCVSHFLSTTRFGAEESEPKPVFSGCDAHSLAELERLTGLVTGHEPTWIKAEPTFRGLQQTLFEPSSRVFIGMKPDVEKRKTLEATKFIASLKIGQVTGYSEAKGRWFKKFDIPINPELTAIIGNKGSGKSAIADIMGLLGDSRQEEHFSFLTDKANNKKFRQKGYAENFEAELTWVSGQVDKKNLAEKTDRTKEERVKYLPQNFFETLTNEIEVKEFQQEIEEVVFSHVEETDRMRTKSFKDLRELKTRESLQEVSALKAKLREANHTIDELIRQAKPEFKESLKKALIAKEEELAALLAAMPPEELEPAQESDEQKKISEELENIAALLATLEGNERACLELIATKKAHLEKAKALNSAMIALGTQIKSSIQTHTPVAQELGLSMAEIVRYEINTQSISDLEKKLAAEIAELETTSAAELIEEDKAALRSLPSIRRAKEELEANLTSSREQLSAPHKRYQLYLQSKLSIEQKMAAIRGDVSSPKPETIAFIKAEIHRIDNDLASSIVAAKSSRREIVKGIFDSKKVVLQFYTDLKASVEGRLATINEDEFKVGIEASFVEAPSFPANFFDIVAQNKGGPFYREGEAVLRNMLSLVDWNDFDSVMVFADSVFDKMQADGYSVENQVKPSKNAKELHDLLYSLEYIDTKYELRLGNKNLNQLSPGEKGLLLLVFYLHLDRENIPLIIDQAEDNLDNDSIFKVLATCIREAKKNRQVILVTHNPNLAVGADAEQILYVKLEKHKNYTLTYESGAIEDDRTNGNIVRVLEGSRPAFVQRRLKYHI